MDVLATPAYTGGPETIRARYVRIGGFTRGFDYLRIGLSIAVVIVHSVYCSYGYDAFRAMWSSWARPVPTIVLPMFFALSGFLVAGSLAKNPSAVAFATLRAVRLVPALAVEILLSAMILGPLLTTETSAAYFTSSGFYAYFLNIFGIIHFYLPGVFTNQPANEVNAALWTIPYELECYVLLIGAYVFGIVRRRYVFVALVCAAIVALTVVAFILDNDNLRFRALPGRALVIAFLVGVCISIFSDKVVLDARLALGSAVAAVVLLIHPTTGYLAAVPAAYLTVYLGMLNPPKIPLLSSGDYSYGLYLFAYPLQQTYSMLFPDHRIWALNALFGISFGLLYAAFSWWCVEKPILSRKHNIVNRATRLAQSVKSRFALTS